MDLDGVLADTVVSCCKIINKRHSKNLTAESIDRWNAWEIAGITKDEFFRSLDEAWYDWKTIPPTEQELGEKVGRLKRLNVVDIVTGRSPETVPYAISWLRELGIPFDTFVRSNSSMDKVNLSYDLFIDDSAELMAVLASKLQGWGVLYLRPWNRRAPEMLRVTKVERWDEIPAVLRRIPNARL